jgi:hypothetical protein
MYKAFVEERPNVLYQWGLEESTCPPTMDERDWQLAKDTRAKAQLLLSWAKQLHGQITSREDIEEELGRLSKEGIKIHWDRIGSSVLLIGGPGEIAEYVTTSTNAYELVRYLIDFEICAQELAVLPKMADRAIDLLNKLVIARSSRTKILLARVAECYLRSMKVEGVIMCRAVLEAAIAEHLDDSDVVGSGYGNQNGGVDLRGQLKYLRAERDLSAEVFKAADSVRTKGNGAIHRDPSTADFDTVFEDLIVALDGIESELGGATSSSTAR